MMNEEQLRSLFQQSSCNTADYTAFLQEVLKPSSKKWEWLSTPLQLDLPNEEGEGEYLGSMDTTDPYKIGFFRFQMKNSVARRRVGLRQLVKKYTPGVDAALVVFDDGSHWRLSFICDLKKEATAPKRFTFVFGDRHCLYHTPVSRFMALQQGEVTFKSLRDAFSVAALTKEFYQKLFNWYQWAVSPEAGVTFPNNTKIEEDDREKIDIKIIRLITRLMFVWFIKQKDLVPDKLFNTKELSKILRDFDPQATDNGNYYNAILQNLFFATLNRAIRDEKGAGRGFAISDRADIKTLYRYAEMFSISESEVIDLFSEVPFLNGGLFECLDKNKTQDGVEIAYYNDGFSRNAERFHKDGHYKYRAFIPNNLFFAKEHKETITSGGSSQVLQVEGLLNIFAQYNFTVEENTPSEQQVALDPELLGKVFENLLGAYNPETQETARKETGSFYTPREIVNYMVDESLLAYLGNSDIVRSLFSEDFKKDSQHKTEYQDIAEKLKNIRILDPACGSGAFPMGLLNRMVDILEKINPNEDTYALKLKIIENCLYGSDIQPIAAQIAKLRFFISLICNCEKKSDEPNFGIPTLPNLETKFVTANSLKAPQSMQLCDQCIIKLRDQLQIVRHKHFNAETVSLKVYWRKEDEALREQLSKLLNKDDAFVSEDVRQMASWNPYDQNAVSPFFDPEWMFGIQGGFDIVMGNPPYIQLQNNGGELGKLYEKCQFDTFAKKGDMYCLFYERGQQLLKKGGHLCYITSNKWMRTDYGKKLRQFFVDKTNPLLLIDFADIKIFESATVDTNILLFANAQNQKKTKCAVANKQNKDSVRNNLSDFVRQQHTTCSFVTSNRWVIPSASTFESIKQKVDSVEAPLKNWNIKVHYGIKTGCNPAFIIDTAKRDEILAHTADYVPGQAEDKYNPWGEYARTAALIRPILRGRDIKRYGYNWAGKWLIATVPSRHYDIDKYPAVKQYLLSFGKERLEQTGETYLVNREKIKSRKKTSNKWFETQDPIAYIQDFDLPKMAWNVIGATKEFTIVGSGICLQNSFHFLVGEHLDYICAMLNSRLMQWLLSLIVGAAVGGNACNADNVTNLPIVRYSLNSQPIADIANKILLAKKQNPTADTTNYERQIDALVYLLYDITSYEELLEIEGNKDSALQMLILMTIHQNPTDTEQGIITAIKPIAPVSNAEIQAAIDALVNDKVIDYVCDKNFPSMNTSNGIQVLKLYVWFQYIHRYLSEEIKAKSFVAPIEKIDDFATLQQRLVDLDNDMDGNYVYRGVNNAAYMMYSSAQRDWLSKHTINTPNDKDGYIAYINSLIKDATPIVAPYLSKNNIPDNEIERLALMQHYESVSPFVDFSTCIYKSLFFAFDDAKCSNVGGLDDYVALYYVSCNNPYLKKDLQNLCQELVQKVQAMLTANGLNNGNINSEQLKKELKKIPLDQIRNLSHIMVSGNTTTHLKIPAINFVTENTITSVRQMNQNGLFIANLLPNIPLVELINLVGESAHNMFHCIHISKKLKDEVLKWLKDDKHIDKQKMYDDKDKDLLKALKNLGKQDI